MSFNLILYYRGDIMKDKEIPVELITEDESEKMNKKILEVLSSKNDEK